MGATVLVIGQGVDGSWAEGSWGAELEADGWNVDCVTTTRAVLERLQAGDVACVVIEAGGPGAVGDDPATDEGDEAREANDDAAFDPLDPLSGVREFGYDVPVILASEGPDGDLAAAATRLDVSEYVPRATTGPSLAERVRAHLRDGSQPVVTDGDGAADSESESTERGAVGAPTGGDLRGATDADAEAGVTVGIGEAGAAVDAVNDGLYVLDTRGRFLVANESLAEMTGYGIEELVGENAAMITTEEAEANVFPAIRRVVTGESESETVSTTVVPRDGDPFPAEDHVTAVTEDGEVVGIAGVIRDVTDKRERTRELERYESIIEAVDDGVYALDDEGRFEVVNDALLDLTGYDREALLGEHTSVIKDEPTVQRAENKLRELVSGNAVETTFELALQPRSGDPVDAEDHMTMLTDEEGRFEGTAGVIRDITDRKERERELRQARERFAELLDTSRALLGAHGSDRVAEIVADAVAETVGYELNVVRLYDPESGRLEAVAGSGSDVISVANRPGYEVGEGGPGRAFEREETLHAPTDVDPAVGDLPESITETLYVPLGDQGTISIGATDGEEFDDGDRSLAEILASNAAVALDRVAYEDELVQYRTVLENVQDMVYVADETGRFSLVTEPLAAWLGVERAALVGTPVASVLDDGSALAAAVADVRDEDVESSVVQTTLRRDDGEALPAEVEVSPLPADEAFAGSVGVVRDRSELVETRERLETQRDRFTYLFDNLPDAVVEASLDEDCGPIVTTINDAFAEVFGYEPATIAGEPLNDLILPADERESGRQLDRAAAEGEVVQCEVRREAADGYRDFLFRGVPFETGTGGTSSFGIYTDITDQKERERRLQVLNRVLRHNLRNDLNVVMGYAEMIAGQVDDESLEEWAETLVETAADVASLGERARSLDRTMREGSLRDGTVGIGGLVADVVTEYRDEFPDVQIATDVDDETVVGDGRIELALRELLENSAEYGGDGVQIRVETEREGGRIALTVADDGPGIPEYERSVVDDSAEITQLEHASGLGLWVVRWVCDACGGRMRFEESDLGGAAVALSLTAADE
ncbi:PAS domain S-box protein [Halosimplex amylolyticum]|uniref:PAS domain S-box protein n=1 Tax=Halosimplex amylolyticum TaxID=3396616 RepID=UPI003F57F818